MDLLPTQELGKLDAKGVQVFPSETNHSLAMPKRERSSQSELGTLISPRKHFSIARHHSGTTIEARYCLRYRFISLITEGTTVYLIEIGGFQSYFGNLHLKSQVRKARQTMTSTVGYRPPAVRTVAHSVSFNKTMMP